MTKYYTASHSLNRSSTGSLRRAAFDQRKAAFDQRKSDYVRSTHDRPAIFIEPSNINNDYVCQVKIHEIN